MPTCWFTGSHLRPLQLVIAAASSQRAGLVVAGESPLGYVCLLSGAHTRQGDAQEADLPAADGQQLVATCCVRAGSTVHKGCTDCWFASQSWLRTVICILAAPERWCCILLAELAHSQMLQLQHPPPVIGRQDTKCLIGAFIY